MKLSRIESYKTTSPGLHRAIIQDGLYTYAADLTTAELEWRLFKQSLQDRGALIEDEIIKMDRLVEQLIQQHDEDGRKE